VNLIPCVSSQLAAYGYDAATKTLVIRFVSSGAIYHYFEVPQAVYDQLHAAESKGSYFIRNIKRAPFKYERQPDAPTELRPPPVAPRVQKAAAAERITVVLTTETDGGYHRQEIEMPDDIPDCDWGEWFHGAVDELRAAVKKGGAL